MKEIDRHSCGEVICSALSEDGNNAIVVSKSLSNECTVLFWDTRMQYESKKQRSLEVPSADPLLDIVCDISWSAQLVAVAEKHGSLFVWNVETGRMQFKTTFNHGPRSCCRFSPCGLFILVSGLNFGELILLESTYGQEILRAYPPEGIRTIRTVMGCFFWVPSSEPRARAGPDETPLPQTPQNTGDVALSVMSDGGTRGRTPLGDYRGYQQRYIRFNRDEGRVEKPNTDDDPLPFTFPTRFGAVYSDGSIRVFDMEGTSYTKSCQFDMAVDKQHGEIDKITDVDVSGDGKLLFVITSKKIRNRDPAELRVYDIDSGKLIWNQKNPDFCKSRVIPSGDSGLVSYDISGGFQSWHMQGRVVWSGSGEIHLYDLSQRTVQLTINTEEHHTYGYGLYPQVHWESQKMITTSDFGEDNWVCHWNLSTGEMIQKYDRIHMKAITGAWLTADGSRCISVSRDRTAALFRLDNGNFIKRFKGHEDYVTFAALSPNEDILVTASDDETVRIWDVDKETQRHVIQYKDWIHNIIFLLSTNWIVIKDVLGQVIGFDTTGKSSPMIFAGDAVKKCNIMKLRPVSPSGAAKSGSALQLPLMITVQQNFRINVLHLHTLSVRQSISSKGESNCFGLPEIVVLSLAKTFPGLAVAPHKDNGETYLHRAVEHSNIEFLRNLLKTSHFAITSAPLPQDCKGVTPLDFALETKNLELVELFLSNELERPPHMRLAARKAFSQLSKDATEQLLKFLDAMGSEGRRKGKASWSRAYIAPGEDELAKELDWAQSIAGRYLYRIIEKKRDPDRVVRYKVNASAWWNKLMNFRTPKQQDLVSPFPFMIQLAAIKIAQVIHEFPYAVNTSSGLLKWWNGAPRERKERRNKIFDLQSPELDSQQVAQRILMQLPIANDEQIMSTPPPYTLLLAVRKWGLPWMKAKENVKPGEIGLPYMATATRNPADSPLGALVDNEALLSTDVGTAIIMYKWNAYAGGIFKWRAWQYIFFIALYITSTTLDLSWNPKVDPESMYGNNTRRGHVATRIVFQASVQLINIIYLGMEIKQLKHLGFGFYFKGPGSLWNWIELISGILVIMVMVLQIANVQEAYWLMSACTLLLGARLLKVLSVFMGTGIYVRVILRIITDIRHYLLIVFVVLMTYALSFRHIVVYYNQAANNIIPDNFTQRFNSFPNSMLSAYYFMVDSLNTETGNTAKYVWYLHVMLISFSFIVSIILLNLLISIMSGTYADVKQHAEMEWRLLIAKDVLEIDSSRSPAYFGGQFKRLGPMWIPLSEVWMKENASKLHKEARDADINDLKQQMLSLQQDMRLLMASNKGNGGVQPPGDKLTAVAGSSSEQ
ncbi:hypothetical protein VaNZ11_007867 [Volvox africanus]|uniref:Ion transport domain-containing protein n=1 Tax=Volvox africanus TaxID=51714 RepID=A0ABQ5S3R2_9CHLO|nr:hypothetical protein VaNZ11_007867 [Volvox africanus]